VLEFFEQGDDLLAFHARKTFEKIINRVARFQVAEQALNGHTRTDKHHRASENVRVGMIDGDLAHTIILPAIDASGKRVPGQPLPLR
jgi:hypothetical protein